MNLDNNDDLDFLDELQDLVEDSQDLSQSDNKSAAKFQTERLEARVLFSATWIDADAGDESMDDDGGFEVSDVKESDNKDQNEDIFSGMEDDENDDRKVNDDESDKDKDKDKDKSKDKDKDRDKDKSKDKDKDKSKDNDKDNDKDKNKDKSKDKDKDRGKDKDKDRDDRDRASDDSKTNKNADRNDDREDDDREEDKDKDKNDRDDDKHDREDTENDKVSNKDATNGDGRDNEGQVGDVDAVITDDANEEDDRNEQGDKDVDVDQVEDGHDVRNEGEEIREGQTADENQAGENVNGPIRETAGQEHVTGAVSDAVTSDQSDITEEATFYEFDASLEVDHGTGGQHTSNSIENVDESSSHGVNEEDADENQISNEILVEKNVDPSESLTAELVEADDILVDDSDEVVGISETLVNDGPGTTYAEAESHDSNAESFSVEAAENNDAQIGEQFPNEMTFDPAGSIEGELEVSLADDANDKVNANDEANLNFEAVESHESNPDVIDSDGETQSESPSIEAVDATESQDIEDVVQLTNIDPAEPSADESVGVDDVNEVEDSNIEVADEVVGVNDGADLNFETVASYESNPDVIDSNGESQSESPSIEAVDATESQDIEDVVQLTNIDPAEPSADESVGVDDVNEVEDSNIEVTDEAVDVNKGADLNFVKDGVDLNFEAAESHKAIVEDMDSSGEPNAEPMSSEVADAGGSQIEDEVPRATEIDQAEALNDELVYFADHDIDDSISQVTTNEAHINDESDPSLEVADSKESNASVMDSSSVSNSEPDLNSVADDIESRVKEEILHETNVEPAELLTDELVDVTDNFEDDFLVDVTDEKVNVNVGSNLDFQTTDSNETMVQVNDAGAESNVEPISNGLADANESQIGGEILDEKDLDQTVSLSEELVVDESSDEMVDEVPVNNGLDLTYDSVEFHEPQMNVMGSSEESNTDSSPLEPADDIESQIGEEFSEKDIDQVQSFTNEFEDAADIDIDDSNKDLVVDGVNLDVDFADVPVSNASDMDFETIDSNEPNERVVDPGSESKTESTSVNFADDIESRVGAEVVSTTRVDQTETNSQDNVNESQSVEVAFSETNVDQAESFAEELVDVTEYDGSNSPVAADEVHDNQDLDMNFRVADSHKAVAQVVDTGADSNLEPISGSVDEVAESQFHDEVHAETNVVQKAASFNEEFIDVTDNIVQVASSENANEVHVNDGSDLYFGAADSSDQNVSDTDSGGEPNSIEMAVINESSAEFANQSQDLTDDEAAKSGHSESQLVFDDSDPSPFDAVPQDVLSGSTNDWGSPEWNDFSTEFETDGDADPPKSNTENVDSDAAISENDLVVQTAIPSPIHLIADELEYFDQQSLNETQIEIVNLESIDESGEESSTSNLTAASMLMLFTTAGDQRTKLKKLKNDSKDESRN